MSLPNRLFSNDSKAQTHEEESCLEFSIGGKIRIREKPLIKILPWLFAALLGGGGAYTFSNMMSPSNDEPNQRQISEQRSLVEQVEQVD